MLSEKQISCCFLGGIYPVIFLDCPIVFEKVKNNGYPIKIVGLV